IRDAERDRGLLDRARDSGLWLASILEGQGELGRNGAHDGLQLGILENRSGHRGDPARSVRSRAQTSHDHFALKLAAVEVRHEPGRGAKQSRLPAFRGIGENEELPLPDLEVDALERRCRPVWVAIRDRFEAKQWLETVKHP